MKDQIKQTLLARAKEARERAYSPYSGFAVGAALLCKSGRITCGANVENASFSPTCCAERVAVFAAIGEGEREFEAIAVVGGKRGEPTRLCPPCGVCRQVLAEFCDGNFEIILEEEGQIRTLTLSELLPYTFSLKNEDSEEPIA